MTTNGNSDPRALRVPGELTRAGLATALGVEEIALGPIYEPGPGYDGHCDVNFGGQIERVPLTLAVDPPRPRLIRVILPPKYAEARERRDYEKAEAARRAEVVACHFAALEHLARPVLAATRSTGCTPAWLAGAEAVDASRAARGARPPISAVTAGAVGLETAVPEALKAHLPRGLVDAGTPPRRRFNLDGRNCRICQAGTGDGPICSGCDGDSDLFDADLTARLRAKGWPVRAVRQRRGGNPPPRR